MALEPITRQEKIIAGQDLTPITRMEMFLKNFGGGGGGGGSTDFVVNVTLNSDSTVTPDKTLAQIQAAIQEGKHPVVKLSGGGMPPVFMPLVTADPDVSVFAAVSDVSEGNISTVSVSITADGAMFDHVASPTLASNDIYDVVLIQYPMESDPLAPEHIATKRYVDNKECILKSTTPGSTKKFKITVDDTGALSTTEVT